MSRHPVPSGQLVLFAAPDKASGPTSDGFVEAFKESTPNLFGTLAHHAQEVAAASGSVTADDLRALVPDGVDKRVVGAVFAHLVRKGILATGVYTKTAVKGNNRRPIVRFVLTGDVAR